MLRSRLLPWLFNAGLFFAAACGDSVSPTPGVTAAPAAPTAPSEPALVTLTGSVHVTGRKMYPVVLSTSDGQDIRLTGESANLLASVDNAGVEVRGHWQSDSDDGGFFVANFLVRSIGGNAVIDGTLVAFFLTDAGGPIGYAIRPTAGGFDIELSEPSEDLLSHLNERIWIAGLDNGPGSPTAYGVIKEM